MAAGLWRQRQSGAGRPIHADRPPACKRRELTSADAAASCLGTLLRNATALGGFLAATRRRRELVGVAPERCSSAWACSNGGSRESRPGAANPDTRARRLRPRDASRLRGCARLGDVGRSGAPREGGPGAVNCRASVLMLAALPHRTRVWLLNPESGRAAEHFLADPLCVGHQAERWVYGRQTRQDGTSGKADPSVPVAPRLPACASQVSNSAARRPLQCSWSQGRSARSQARRLR